MEYTYSQPHLKDWLGQNLDRLLEDPSFQALIVEVKVAEDVDNKFVDCTGYDDISKDGIRYETKFTNYLMNNSTLRINRAGKNKKGKFDILRIIDGINERIFEIPHDEYYEKGKRYGNEFRWSGTYNEADNVQQDNTALVLKFETTTT